MKRVRIPFVYSHLSPRSWIGTVFGFTVDIADGIEAISSRALFRRAKECIKHVFASDENLSLCAGDRFPALSRTMKNKLSGLNLNAHDLVIDLTDDEYRRYKKCLQPTYNINGKRKMLSWLRRDLSFLLPASYYDEALHATIGIKQPPSTLSLAVENLIKRAPKIKKRRLIRWFKQEVKKLGLSEQDQRMLAFPDDMILSRSEFAFRLEDGGSKGVISHVFSIQEFLKSGRTVMPVVDVIPGIDSLAARGWYGLLDTFKERDLENV